MNALEDRVEHALEHLAASIDVDTSAARVAVANRPQQLSVTPATRRPAWLAAAAALIVVGGAGGLWLTQRQAAAPAAPVTSLPSTPDPNLPAGLEPLLHGATAVLDPALGLGEPYRDNPWQAWVRDPGHITMQFVRFVADAPVASIAVHAPYATDFDLEFQGGPVVDLGEGVQGRRADGDGGAGGLYWPEGTGVASVTWRGDVDDEVAIALARQAVAGDDVEAPEGFEALGGFEIGQATSYLSGASLTLFRSSQPTDPLRADAIAFVVSGGAEHAGNGAWVGARSSSGDGSGVTYDRVFRSISGDEVVMVSIPGWSELDAVDAATDSVQIVPVEDVPIETRVSFDASPPRADHEFGEIDAERWLLSTWADDERTGSEGQNCWVLDVSWGPSAYGCRDEPVPDCVSYVELGANGSELEWWALVRGTPAAVAAQHDGQGPSAGRLERSGQFTVAIGTVDGADGQPAILVDGQPADCPSS